MHLNRHCWSASLRFSFILMSNNKHPHKLSVSIHTKIIKEQIPGNICLSPVQSCLNLLNTTPISSNIIKVDKSFAQFKGEEIYKQIHYRITQWGLCKTTLEANSKPLSQVNHQVRHIPRRCSVPTAVLHRPELPEPDPHKNGYGCRFRSGAKISDLLFMYEVNETWTHWFTPAESTATTSSCHSTAVRRSGLKGLTYTKATWQMFRTAPNTIGFHSQMELKLV